MFILEWIGAFTGVVGIILTQRRNIWCFPIGILSVIISFYIFLDQKLFADSLQQIFYFVLLITGWISWNKNRLDNHEVIISRCTKSHKTQLLLAVLSFALLLGYILQKYTSATFPWIDSTATSIAFAAQWLVAKRKLENWHLWIIVNVTYIAIYCTKSLWIYAALYFIYLLLSFIGLYQWKKELANDAII